MGTAHEGSQQKPIQTMQLPKEVGTEGPAVKVIGGLPEKAARAPSLLCARGRGPVAPSLPCASWRLWDKAHWEGGGGVRGTRAWTGRVRVRWSPTRAGQGG